MLCWNVIDNGDCVALKRYTTRDTNWDYKWGGNVTTETKSNYGLYKLLPERLNKTIEETHKSRIQSKRFFPLSS